jgi:cytohesin
MEKQMKAQIEEKTLKMEKEIESLRSVVARHESDNSQLKLDNARLLTDLSEVHTDLRILHPLPYARLNLQKCINHQILCNDAVNAFISRHTLSVIYSTPPLTLQLHELKRELKKAWDARFSAAFLCEPLPTLDKVLWIVAKNGHTKEVMRCMNVNQATRSCKMLQKVMREVKGKDGMTQLNYFACKGMISSVNRMLLMKGIDVESRDDNGNTPLINAAAYGFIEIVEMLLNHGARIEGKDDDGCTSLHAASSRGHLSAVNLLINKGANFEVSSVHGWKSLHTAASNGHLKIVKALIEKGADMNALTKGGQSALGWARRKNRHKIVDFLRTRGAIDDDN